MEWKSNISNIFWNKLLNYNDIIEDDDIFF